MKTVLRIITVIALLASSTSYGQFTDTHSFTLNQSIPDGDWAGMSDTRSVTSTVVTMTSLRVKVHVAGEFNGDLYAYLRHIQPDRTNLCVLLNRAGRTATNPSGYADAGLNVTFDDTAANGDIHLYQSLNLEPSTFNPLAGTWQPDGRKVDPATVTDTSPRTTTLAAFNGGSASGEWTIFLADVESGGTNQLVSWELEFHGAVEPPITWPIPADIVYGTALGAGQLNASSSVAGVFVYSPPTGTILNAGSAQMLSVTFTPSDTANYVPVTRKVSINVLQKALTIAAENKTKVYGEPVPSLTATYSGFVNGDTPNSLTPVTFATTAGALGNVGSYAITPGGASSSNYDITFVDGTLSITKASLSGLLTSSQNPAIPGTLVTFSCQLTAIAPGAGLPGGNVQFRIDDAIAGTASLNAGAAAFSTSTLNAGTHTIDAEYPGDQNFFGFTNRLTPDQLSNTLPVASPDTIERPVAAGVKVSIATLLSNDSDADGDSISFVSVASTSASGGIITRSNGWIFYTPPRGHTNGDSFTYTITDGRGSTVDGTVTITVRPAVPSPELNITDLGNGSFRLTFNGIPDISYRIESSENTDPSSWQTLGTTTADANGLCEFIDTPPPNSDLRYYRAVHP